jgi:Cysteine rich repeat
MITQVSSRQIGWAVATCVAGVIALSQLSHPGRALPMSTPTTATRDAQAPGFETDIADRGAALLLACRQDARQLCSNVVPGQGRVVRCLTERRNDLSDYCQSAMLQRRLNFARLRRTAQD